MTAAADAQASSTATTDTAKATIPPGAEGVVHGHIEHNPTGPYSDGLIDDTKGLGDSQALKAGLTNHTVFGPRIGVHEILNGRLQFRMTAGTMSAHEVVQIQRNLNNPQQYFDLPIQVPMPAPLQFE